MTTFADNFNRGDGDPGADWVHVLGNVQIESNALGGQSSGSLRLAAATFPGNVVETVQHVTASGAYNVVLSVKANADLSDCYRGELAVEFLPVTFYVRLVSGGTVIATQSAQMSEWPSEPYTLALSYVDGLVSLSYNGVVKVTMSDSTHATNGAVGIAMPGWGSKVDSIDVSEPVPPVSIALAPDPLWVGGGDVPMVATGTNTAWTVGVPGSSTFTVDHGTISDQRTTSPTEVRFTYTPAEYVGTLTFTETEYGASDTVSATVDPAAGSGSGWGSVLSPAVQTWLANQAQHGGLVIADNDVTGGSVAGIDLKGAWGEILLGVKTGAAPGAGYAASADLVRSIFARLWGGEEWEGVSFAAPGTGALKTDLAALLAVLSLAKTGGSFDVGTLARELSGFPGGSHQDILDAIAALPAADQQPVLDAIAAAQGDPLATTKAVLDLVYTVKTTEGYDLGDVLAAVQAIPTALVDLSPVLTAIETCRSQQEAQYLQIRADIAGTAAQIVTAMAALTLLQTTLTGVGDVADSILDVVNGLQADAAAEPHVPLWPGLAGASIGASVALEDGLEIVGPLDGLLVHITTTPARAGRYAFGDQSSWKYVGAVVFRSDRGDYEWNHPIGLDSQVITPKCMTHAAAARFRLESGWSGTVRPFTVGA